jgi:hypothetical protein
MVSPLPSYWYKSLTFHLFLYSSPLNNRWIRKPIIDGSENEKQLDWQGLPLAYPPSFDPWCLTVVYPHLLTLSW